MHASPGAGPHPCDVADRLRSFRCHLHTGRARGDQDRPVSRDLGRPFADFHAKGKITALVCHGPIALMSALNEPTQLEAGEKPRPGAWIYAVYNFTVIGNEEEEQAKPLVQGG
jgi:putative intracellular protease/amidase